MSNAVNTTKTIPVGIKVRGHQYRAGIVTGHVARGWAKGFPLVKLDGEARAWATNPAQLITEAEYQAIIATALAKTA